LLFAVSITCFISNSVRMYNIAVLGQAGPLPHAS